MRGTVLGCPGDRNTEFITSVNLLRPRRETSGSHWHTGRQGLQWLLFLEKKKTIGGWESHIIHQFFIFTFYTIKKRFYRSCQED